MDDEPTASDYFETYFEDFIATLARLFAHKGNAAAVSVLSEGNANWIFDGRIEYVRHGLLPTYSAMLNVPQEVFNSALERISDLEIELRDEAQILMRHYPGVVLQSFIICPQHIHDSNWRLKAKDWLKGEGVHNQGRVEIR